MRLLARRLPLLLAVLVAGPVGAQRAAYPTGPSPRALDLANPAPSVVLTRAHGALWLAGSAAVPVSGGGDVDGDGLADFVAGYPLASLPPSNPPGAPRTHAGMVNLVFGTGVLGETIDFASEQTRVLHILGEGNIGSQETCGNEVQMADVTGDGLADLVICRQNFAFFPGTVWRKDAGAVTVVVGSPALRNLALAGTDLALGNPPPSVKVFTVVGANASDRLGIWARAGDMDGDGILDLALGADLSNAVDTQAGEVYVI